jgi:putative DNA primase/helicase
MPSASAGTIREFLDAITAPVPVDPDKKRYLIVAVGLNPFINAKGSYGHKDWEELPFLWPDQVDKAIAEIEHWAPKGDVYACPYLMKTSERLKGNAAWRQIIHSDVDGNLDLAKVRKVGGFVVWSGSNGHGHVYVPLGYAISQQRHERLCEGLRGYLGGDSKIRDNDLLRPAGTFNHKPTLAGGQPALVKAEKP